MTRAGVVVGSTPRVGARDRDAWTQFWADETQSRCAAGAPAIWQSLLRHWWNFARSLPPGTRVLDLGCGAGAVGRMLLAARDDLRITGVDAARVPRSALPRMELLSETDMESLPFGESSFGAVVSQFGYEYSRTNAAAREVARVLAPGGGLSLIVHHTQSEIVRASRERLGAVVAFLAPETRTPFCAGDSDGFGARLALLVESYPDDALITHLARALPARLGWLAEQRASTWHALEEALAPEQCMSQSLDACAVPPSRVDEWLAPLAAACELRPVEVLREADGTPIAWRAEGVRSA